jgi:hypothetical protein
MVEGVRVGVERECGVRKGGCRGRKKEKERERRKETRRESEREGERQRERREKWRERCSLMGLAVEPLSMYWLL